MESTVATEMANVSIGKKKNKAQRRRVCIGCFENHVLHSWWSAILE